MPAVLSKQWPTEAIFTPFVITEHVYKNVNSHPIQAAILLPKILSPGAHPLLINIHGGFLIYASSLHAPFFAPWTLDLAQASSAIVVSADYRLLPSAGGVLDVLEDLEDFWQWTRNTLPDILGQSGHSVDWSHVLMTGGSAGGYGAVQLAISHPDEISILSLTYPLLDLKDPIFTNGPGKDEPTILRMPIEDMPSEKETLRWVEENRSDVVSKAGDERAIFAVALTQHGMVYEKVFNNQGLERKELFPMRRIEGARLPRKVWILHGDDDSVVHIRASQKFVDLVSKNSPKTTVRFDVAKDGDHGLDNFELDWEEKYAKGALDFIRGGWLS